VTNLTPEERRIVEWLRRACAFEGSIFDRIRGAWYILFKPKIVLFSFCLQIADAIERGEHKEQQ